MIVPAGKEHLARKIAGWRWHPNTREYSWPIIYRERIMGLFPETIDTFKNRYKILVEVGLVPPPPDGSIKPDAPFPLPSHSTMAAGPVQHGESSPPSLSPAPQPTLFEAAMAQNKFGDYQFKVPPFAHQRDILDRLLDNKQYALFCEMGTGKTKPVIDLVGILKAKGENPRVLVLCPNTLLDNWAEEIVSNSSLTHAIIPKSKNKRTKVLTGEQDVTIMNYEKVILFQDLAPFMRFNMVVLDESHKIKSHLAKRTKTIMQLFGDRDIRKYCLTGTPVGQCFTDIYTQMSFLNPAFLGFASFYSFRNHYGVIEDGYAPGGRTFKKVTGLKPEKKVDLNERIALHSIQLKKEDCHSLPPKLYSRQTVEMSPAMAVQYKKMQKDLMIELSTGTITASVAVVKILRLQEILGGHYLPQGDNNKLKLLKEIITEQVEYNNPVIIWAHYIKSIKAIEAMVGGMGLEYSIIYGAIQDRQDQIHRFQAEKAKVFIGQIATGGVGITLTAANIAVYYENEYSLINRKQSEDRCHRIGQRRAVTYVDLLYKDTLEYQIMKSLRENQATATDLVRSFMKGEY
jgi:SNF2 family DNA or RNA helicase